MNATRKGTSTTRSCPPHEDFNNPWPNDKDPAADCLARDRAPALARAHLRDRCADSDAVAEGGRTGQTQKEAAQESR